MCRVFRLVLLGALLALPLSAAQKAEPSLAAFLQTLNPASAAQAKSVCPLGDPGCPCEPVYDNCSRQYTGINFVRQKPNYVCVYQCTYTDTCYDSECGRPSPIVTSSAFRVRSQPYEYPWGGCPAADISFCSTMEVGE